MGWHVHKVMAGTMFGLLLFSNAAMATCPAPVQFSNGQTADASVVYGDIKSITDCLNASSIGFSGNVGIGTASPTHPLQVNGSIGNIATIFSNDSTAYSTSSYSGIDTMWLSNTSTAAGTGAGIGFSMVGTGPGEVASIAGIYTGAGGSDYSTALVFQTRASSGPDGERMRITSAGSVGIGTTSPSYTLHVNGSVAGTSAYNNLSDARLKKNIAPVVDGLAIVSQLRPVRFDWRSENERDVGREFNLPAGKQIGFIAQDIAKVLPEAVSTAKGKDAIMSVAESKVVPALVSAVQELKASNDNQASEIAQLEAQVVALQRKVEVQSAQR